MRVTRPVFRLLDSFPRPLGRPARKRRGRGRTVVVVVSDEADAVRVGRFLVAVVVVVVHQNALACRAVARRGVRGASRLGRRHRTRTTAARRRHGLAIVVGRHVNGQHVRLYAEKPEAAQVRVDCGSIDTRQTVKFRLKSIKSQ